MEAILILKTINSIYFQLLNSICNVVKKECDLSGVLPSSSVRGKVTMQ